jgi:hypothetical protein
MLKGQGTLEDAGRNWKGHEGVDGDVDVVMLGLRLSE